VRKRGRIAVRELGSDATIYKVTSKYISKKIYPRDKNFI